LPVGPVKVNAVPELKVCYCAFDGFATTAKAWFDAKKASAQTDYEATLPQMIS
jgi:hypothetical protein